MTRLAPLLMAVLLTALVSLSIAFGQADSLHLVPEENVRLAGEAITIDGRSLSDTFVPGLGWLSGSGTQAPILEDGAIYLDRANLQRLGLDPAPDSPTAPPRHLDPWTTPLTSQVRFGGESEIRVVVDLPQLQDSAALEGLERQGRLEDDRPLILDLPRLVLPAEQPDPYHGIDVSLIETVSGTRFELYGPASSYRVFTLDSPTRLVVDVVPLRREHIEPTQETLREGVLLRTFGATTPSGESRVHLLEIAPNSGEFRVVGTSEVPRTLSELADGAFAAINGGYFDTRTFQAIGLLRVDYGIQSLPSRNRASIGFGFTGPLMTRVTARVNVRIGGRAYRRQVTADADGVRIHTISGTTAGSPRRGALVARHGRIVANRVGPVTVPDGGFVVDYPPEDRQLALIDAGTRAAIEVDFDPRAFETVRYAVEAGPLLVQDGSPAFEPDLEQFSRGQRILDAYTQQSAIGIRPDGTVLFLVAEDMRASDLVPLFLSLGASHAMRLDSGSSATLLADGQILNRATQRRIVSAIVFLPSGS